MSTAGKEGRGTGGMGEGGRAGRTQEEKTKGRRRRNRCHRALPPLPQCRKLKIGCVVKERQNESRRLKQEVRGLDREEYPCRPRSGPRMRRQLCPPLLPWP